MALFQGVVFAAGGHQYPALIHAATIAIYSLPISMVGLVFLGGLIAAFLRLTLRPPAEPDVFLDPITHRR